MSTVNQEIAQDAKTAIQAKADRLDELSRQIDEIDNNTQILQRRIAQNNIERGELTKESLQLLREIHLVTPQAQESEVGNG